MRRFLFAVFLLLLAVSSHASQPFVRYEVVLMQADMVLQERVDATALGDYIKAVESNAKHVVAAKAGDPASGFIVVAVRPGQRSNVWLDFNNPLPAGVETALVDEIRSVFPMQVQDGPVLFALRVGLWGGAAPERKTPVPKAWSDAAKKIGRDDQNIDDIVTSVWQD